MSIWALVPQKALVDSKRRLAPLLSDDERRRLVRFMLDDVLAMLRAVRGLSGIAIVTPDRSLVPDDMMAIEDPGAGLNGALGHGAATLLSIGARAMLVVPGDVPLAQAAEIEAILEAGRRSPVVIVSDRAGTGTNAIRMPLPAPLLFRFGPGSCERHIAAARACGPSPAMLTFAGLGFDVDEPSDVSGLARAMPARYAPFAPRLKAAS